VGLPTTWHRVAHKGIPLEVSIKFPYS